MQTKIRWWMALVGAPLLMVAPSSAEGQAPPVRPPAPVAPPKPPAVVVEDVLIKPAPSKLEEMLAEALKNNPDVRVAESKLREAEAQLNRARMQVMQKAVALRSTLDAQGGAVKEAEALLKSAEAKVKRFSQLYKDKAIDESVLEEAMAGLEIARQKLLAAKTRSAELEGEVNFLLGKHGVRFVISFVAPDAKSGAKEPLYDRFYKQDVPLRTGELIWHLKVEPGSTADRIRKALDKPVRLSALDKEKPLADVLKEIEGMHGVSFVIASKKVGETKVPVPSDGLPLGAVLEMFEDLVGVRFAVRDYGVLATSAESLPAGAVPLYTFWKSPAPAASTTKPKEKEGENKP